jgi:hypothetical protein
MTTVKSIFGLNSREKLFDHFWKSQGFRADSDGLTQSIQGAMQNPAVHEQYKGFLARAFKAQMEPERAKATATTVVTVSGSVAGEIVPVTSIDATNITVAIKKPDGSAGTAQTVYWRAEV